MDIKPILSALGRHRVATTLIVLEIALACAVLCNAFFLVSGRLALIGTDSGLAEDSLTFVALRGCDGCRHPDVNARATAALSAIPGVQAVGVVNAMPFGIRAGDAGIHLDREAKHFGGVPHFYMFGPGAIEAMGVRPETGRAFTGDDFQDVENFLPASSRVWITRAHAEHLWPDEDPLGREFWTGGMHFRVAGVLANFSRPNPGRSENGIASKEWSVIVPLADESQSGVYVVRADPADLPRVAEAARREADGEDYKDAIFLSPHKFIGGPGTPGPAIGAASRT